MLSFKSSLYNLDTRFLSGMCFKNTYLACIFILLTVTFPGQDFLILINFKLSIFPFTDHTSVVISKHSPLKPK